MPRATSPPASTTPPNRVAESSRSEQRNAAIRATLSPLAPGERPWPLRIAIAVALLIAVGNVVQAAVGANVKVAGTRSSVSGSLFFSLIMLVCAVGMWRLRYWAVLGFQALLALVIIAFVFVALTANDVLRLLVALVIIGAGGTLFWKLVHVLSRLQMPENPGSSRR